jgi:chromosome segregation ATPase
MKEEDGSPSMGEPTDPFLSLRKEEEEARLSHLLGQLDLVQVLFSTLENLKEENENLKEMVRNLELLLEERETELKELKGRAQSLRERLERILFEMNRHVQRT